METKKNEKIIVVGHFWWFMPNLVISTIFGFYLIYLKQGAGPNSLSSKIPDNATAFLIGFSIWLFCTLIMWTTGNQRTRGKGMPLSN